MAKPPEDRERPETDEEDLFEDLDAFFAPIGELPEEEEGTERSSEEPAAPPESATPETDAALEDFRVDIEIPEEEELLEGLPLEESQVPAADEPLTVDDLKAAPAEYADLPSEGAESEEEEEEPTVAGEPQVEEPVPPEEEAPVLEEEAVASAADLFEAEPPPETVSVGEPLEPEAEPEPEVVEAAAEHFATGMRESPEEIERELLADLEGAPSETVTIEPGTAAAEAPPTWEEGAVVTEEAGPPTEPGAPARNLTAAFASGILLAAAVIALLAIGKGPFTILAGAIVLLGQAELYAVMRARGLQPATLLGLVCGALIIAGAYFKGAAAVSLGLALSTALTVLWYMAAPAKARRSTAVNAGVTMLGTMYVPFLASFAILLLILPGDLGRNVFLTVAGLTILYDVCAYAIGSLWGSRPLAPTISPQKSWEGVIGATFILLLVALAIVPSIEPFDASRAVGLALVIAVAAPIGDLVESALKRDLGVKDMGSILPGHGGILDRIDAVLFAVPAAYYFYLLAF